MDVFHYSDYKKFLTAQIKANRGVYGYKARLAEAAGCQRSFLSQVLHGSTDLLVEHAAGLAEYWRLAGLEREYFVELVHHARAATPALRRYVESRLAKLKSDRENLNKRYGEKLELPEQEAALYVSSWHHSAIHMLLTVPDYQTASRLARRLNLPEPVVEQSLELLRSLGFVQKTEKGWALGSKNLHLPRESRFNSLNHGNWRNRAVTSSLSQDPSDIHYTALYSMSLADREKLRQLLFAFIDETRKTVAPSREEDLFCLTCDFFRV